MFLIPYIITSAIKLNHQYQIFTYSKYMYMLKYAFLLFSVHSVETMRWTYGATARRLGREDCNVPLSTARRMSVRVNNLQAKFLGLQGSWVVREAVFRVKYKRKYDLREMGLSSKEKILREIWGLRLSTFG
jgi:hypothetical protein